DGGTSHEIPTGGSVRQTFKASTPFIRAIGVIVGVNPSNSTEPSHRLTLELVDQHETVLKQETVDLQNNALTSVSFQPIPVVLGGTYELRITNISRDNIGVYLNSPVRQNRTADADTRAF